MSDVQLLFLVLAVLYAWECACWVTRGTVVFRSWLGRAWHSSPPSTLLGNQRGGFTFAHPLPPLGAVENEDWGRDYVLQCLLRHSDEELAAVGLARTEGTA